MRKDNDEDIEKRKAEAAKLEDVIKKQTADNKEKLKNAYEQSHLLLETIIIKCDVYKHALNRTDMNPHE
eukprot:CAMPEP_0116892346 /NCGR_PEP_ID=MMETSP0467-20121206/2596_1 /TAXON_ID=283647 /ORGANISM="Mesodinium pulex, Strain SPMC105" /LENGTH=68 /DNA_ID=CAMNT_0004561437 /DNA_START=793 /DNA_END=999 /DNA_ORIENTATION=-